LADTLRHGRLSVLSGVTGAGKTSLITGGLMPLLRRRATDGAIADADRESAVIMPFPERRSAARARLAELVILFDQWDEAPLAGLHRAIDAALRAAGVEPRPPCRLADRVKDLADRHGARLLFVFDAFDKLLHAWEPSVLDPFIDDLVDMVNRRVPAHVLISLRSESEPLLQPLGDRLSVDDVAVLVLPHWSGDEMPAAPSAAPEPPLPSVPTPPPAQSPRLHVVPRRAVVAAAPQVKPTQTPALPADHATPSAPPGLAGATPARRPSPRIWVMAGVALLLAASLLVLLAESTWRAADLSTSNERAAQMLVAAPPEQALQTPTSPLPPPLPSNGVEVGVHVDAEDGIRPRLPAELARALAADGRIDLRVRAGGAGAAKGPHLSIVRYDALTALAQQAVRPSRVAVVAPLYTEELFAVVRSDSPLNSIDQLEGRRINIGPEFGDRALTAATVYQRMFGKTPTPTRDAHLGATAALETLAAGDSLDAVLLVEPQPAATLNALPPATRRALKLLPLDAQHPAGRRLLQAYLPATIRRTSVAELSNQTAVPTVGAMAFLVSDGQRDDAESQTLVRLVDALCRVLPQLRREGDPKWREVRAGQQLDTGWPVLPATDAAWRRCAAEPAASGTATLPATSSTPPVQQPKGEHS
jgi:TRAP-type uncharacterized transport system substrate-binding protein